jgi:hypothetical protein
LAISLSYITPPLPPSRRHSSGPLKPLAHPGRPCRSGRGRTATERCEIVKLRFGAGLDPWTNPKPQRRACSPRYGVPSCRGTSAGVAKRPRERSPTRNPNGYDSLNSFVAEGRTEGLERRAVFVEHELPGGEELAHLSKVNTRLSTVNTQRRRQ